jgi:lysophospholipase L1-like esterase
MINQLPLQEVLFVRRRFAKLAVASVVASAVVASGLVLAVSAQAEIATPLNVVALGDSYGSGTGAGDYLDGTGTVHGCYRSANSYSETLVARLRDAGRQVSFTNVTCSGAATADLRQVFKGEPPQLDALSENTNVVFLSIGSNDIEFAGYGGLCIAADCSGAATQDELAKVPGMGQNVAALLDDIKARSPRAKVVMTGYGQQLTLGENAPGVALDPLCGPEYFTSQERVEGNQVARSIDATLRKTARQAHVAFVSPYVNSVDLDPSFAGHSLCESTDPYYRGFDALASGEEGSDAILHPSRTGQTALADLIAGAAQAGDVSPAIIGGNPADQTYSFMASLQYTRNGVPNSHRCGGALVRAGWVVTAAHCVTLAGTNGAPYTVMDPALFHVRVGTTDRTAGGSVANIKKIVVHPDYVALDDRASGNDIALLQLDTPVSEQPVRLSALATTPGVPVREIGWGYISNADVGTPANLPVQLQQLDTELIPPDTEKCRLDPEEGDAWGIRTGDVCADNPEGEFGPCGGDSGSPLLRQVDGRWELVGVDSRGVGELCGGSPDIYTSTVYFYGWIITVTD